MTQRNVITGENSTWLRGHREEFFDGEWKVLLRSDWVFALKLGDEGNELLSDLTPVYIELKPNQRLGAYVTTMRNN